jgi:hypothetical protein
MFFLALKLIRFLVKLVVKIVLLPVKLVKLAMGMQSGSSGDEYGEFDLESESDDSAGGIGGSTSVGDSDLLDVDPGTAARNIVWFRWGLLAVGTLQLVIGLVMLFRIVTAMSGPATNTGGIVGGIIGATVAASLPLLAALAITRRPTGGWYAGMGLTALQIVGSVFTLPVGLLWIVVYSPIAYLGYTGRPALDVVYGDESRASAETEFETTSASAEADAGEDAGYDVDSIERAEPTAATSESTTASEPAVSADASTSTADASSTDAQPAEPAPEPGGDEADAADAPTADDGATDADAGTTVEPYRDELTASDPSARARAIEELASAVADDPVPEQAAVDALVERLDDDDPTVRSAACQSLGSLGVERAEPRLKDLRIDPDPEVSRAATRALRNFE